MTSTDRETVIDRVKKLLALAGNNANVNEAGAAAARAQQLMLEHKIAALEVDISDDGDEPTLADNELGSTSRPVPTWRRELMGILAPRCFCKPVLLRVPHSAVRLVRVIGTPEDAAVFKELYEYLAREIMRLQREANPKASTAWITEFRRGAVLGIDRKMAELSAHHMSDSRALVVFQRSAAQLEAFTTAKFGAVPAAARHPRALRVRDASLQGFAAGHSVDVKLPGTVAKLTG